MVLADQGRIMVNVSGNGQLENRLADLSAGRCYAAFDG